MADSNVTLIVGGGFVGLFTALHLRHKDYPHPIVLIDPQSQFAFKPMLYDFLSGEMQTEQVFPSYQELLTRSDITFVQDTATQIDLPNRRVQTASGKSYHYGNLVLGVGSSQGYFGTEGAAENAFAFHTQSDEELQQHPKGVELRLGVSVKSVTADSLTYQAQPIDPIQTLATATTIWSAGTTANPLLKTLSLPDNRSDRNGLPLVTPTLQLADFPEVFAGGDCAIVEQKSLPALAQVAYQQGAGIAHNLIALAEGKPPKPVQVNLRGTLMKLGMGKGLANIFDRVQIGGIEGALIRDATYLEMLPTPIHNFKATAEWIQESIFNSFTQPAVTIATARSQPATPAKTRAAVLWIGGGLAIASVIIGAIVTAERSPQWRESTHYQAK